MKSARPARAATLWLSRPGGVAERPGQCIVGHDAEPDLVGHDQPCPAWIGKHRLELGAGCIGIIARPKLVAQPQCQAIDQHRLPLALRSKGAGQIERSIESVPALAPPRPVDGDPLSHLLVEGYAVAT